MTTVLPPVEEGGGSWRGRRRRTVLLSAVLLVAAGVCAAAAVTLSSGAPLDRLTTSGRGGSGTTLPPGKPVGAGVLVPAADLVSDPVFVTMTVGFALETSEQGSLTIERLAKSADGGRHWYVTGSPFPVPGDFTALQFVSTAKGYVGYVFGESGLLVTSDGGRTWSQVASLDGTLQRAIPIPTPAGENVWATFTRCSGPPGVDARCPVGLAISRDGGRHWRDASAPPITEAPNPLGGDILARYSLTQAYVVSYGPVGGGLAYTADSGHSWKRLPDPCSGPWAQVDMAAPNPPGALWLICGAVTSAASDVQPKVVYQSSDGGEIWHLMASSGFAPGAPTAVGSLPLSGRVSQLATIDRVEAWLGVAGLGVIETFDSGRTWHVADGFLGGSAERLASEQTQSVGVTFNNGVDGWAIEFRHGVFVTTDAVHWRLLDGS